MSNARMVYLSVPVKLNWLTCEGSEVNEATATLQVSAEGAIVLVRTAPPVFLPLVPQQKEEETWTCSIPSARIQWRHGDLACRSNPSRRRCFTQSQDAVRE